jgi:hypothetical protein
MHNIHDIKLIYSQNAMLKAVPEIQSFKLQTNVTKKEGTQKTNRSLFAPAGAHRTTLQTNRNAHTQHNYSADSRSGSLPAEP